MPGVILTSPQCGGTHAMMALLKGYGLQTVGRHRNGLWYPKGLRKHPRPDGVKIDRALDLPDGTFLTGHSGPFATSLPVICNLRDPRNIILCHRARHWREKSIAVSLSSWLTNPRALVRISKIPRYWGWHGDSVLKIWYEDIWRKDTQQKIADFCGTAWRRTDFYGHGKRWSGQPSDWRVQFDAQSVVAWQRLWREATSQDWDRWWHQNGRRR